MAAGLLDRDDLNSGLLITSCSNCQALIREWLSKVIIN